MKLVAVRITFTVHYRKKKNSGSQAKSCIQRGAVMTMMMIIQPQGANDELVAGRVNIGEWHQERIQGPSKVTMSRALRYQQWVAVDCWVSFHQR
jgi:hypothetical protein